MCMFCDFMELDLDLKILGNLVLVRGDPTFLHIFKKNKKNLPKYLETLFFYQNWTKKSKSALK